MRPIVYIDEAAWSVGPSVTVASRTKTAEPIDVPFRMRPEEPCVRWGPDPHEKGQFCAGVAHCNV